MRNDTPATAGRPFQNAPLIVFEARGYVGGVDHLWEMNEKFFTRSLLGSRPESFRWLLYRLSYRPAFDRISLLEVSPGTNPESFRLLNN